MSNNDRVLRNDDLKIKSVIDKLLSTDSFIQSLCGIIKNTLTELLTEFNTKIDAVEEKISDLSNKIDGLELYSGSNIEFNTKMDAAEKKISELSNKLDGLEQYSRANSLRIFGVEETEDENITDKVISICKDKLNVNVTVDMIDACHRLGQKEQGSRPVIIKFCSKSLRNKIFNVKKKLKGSKIIIREDLTKCRAQLLKEVQKKSNSKQVWSSRGIIMCKINNKLLKFEKFSDLDVLSNT